MDNNEHIDKHLQDELNSYRVDPNIRSFDMVLKKMQEKKRRRFFFILFPGIGLLTGLLAFYLFSNVQALQSEQLREPVSEIIKPGEKSINENKVRSQKIKQQKHNQVKKEAPPAASDNKLSKGTDDKKQLNNGKKYPPRHHSSILTAVNEAGQPLATGEEKKSFENNNVQRDQPAAQTPGNDPGNNLPPTGSLPAIAADPIDSIKTTNDPITEINNIAAVEKKQAQQDSTTNNNRTDNKTDLEDLIKDKPPVKKIRFSLGLSAAPQLGSNIITANKHRSPVYDGDTARIFSDNYLKSKQAQNTFRINYSLALKLGLNFNDQWEVFAGIGYQVYRDKEDVSHPPLQPWSRAFAYAAGSSGGTSTNASTNTFKYIVYQLEAGKIMNFHKIFKVKAGLGLQAGYLWRADALTVSSSAIYDYGSKDLLSKWVYTTNIKLGLITELSKKVQFQLGPHLFYAINSTFVKNYVIRQNSYGIALEGTLLFRLN